MTARNITMSKDYYTILGVPTDATTDEIVEAYYGLSKMYHPVLNSDPAAAVQMQEISVAWQVLSDRRARQKYDVERRAARRRARWLRTRGRYEPEPRRERFTDALWLGVERNTRSLAMGAIIVGLLLAIYLPLFPGLGNVGAASRTPHATGTVPPTELHPSDPRALARIGASSVIPTVAAVNTVAAVSTVEAVDTVEPVNTVQAVDTPEPVDTVEAVNTVEAVDPVETSVPPLMPTVAQAPTRKPVMPTAARVSVAPRPALPTPLLPTASAVFPTRTKSGYPAPVLKWPPMDFIYNCGPSMHLQWSMAPGVTLGPDEWFVAESRLQGTNEWHALGFWTQQLSEDVWPTTKPRKCTMYGMITPGRYEWYVQIVKGNPDTQTVEQFVSPSSWPSFINFGF